MSTRVDAEEIERSRSEKLLAVVLAIFIAIGGLWGYFKLDEIGKPQTSVSIPNAALSVEDRQAIKAGRQARSERFRARRQLTVARRELELNREDYRTALESGAPAEALEASYLDARSRHRSAEEELAHAQRRAERSQRAARAAVERRSELRRGQDQQLRAERAGHNRQTFALRLGLVLAMLAVGYGSLSRLRARRSRYLIVSLAFLGASAAVAVVMAAHYIGERIDVVDFGPLALSLIGSALTLGALVVLQRYMARRAPMRRLRRGQCPFCGHPASATAHCEGCGRPVVASCSTCDGLRRVGSAHCGTCGAT